MITVEEASQIVLEKCYESSIESVSLENAQGRILAQDVVADRNFPPFDRVTMDGIAIHYDQFITGRKTYRIEGVAAAGSPELSLLNPENCLEVMTGAMLPMGTDTVIRYEDLEISEGSATITIDEITIRQNVHFKGSDRAENSLLIKAGKVINAPELGVLATCGVSKVQVRKVPTVAIVSSGDELVPITEKPAPHQIRRSNNYSISGALKTIGVHSDYFHLVDDPEVIQKEMSSILKNYDVIILSGGVSMGKFDYIPRALELLGVEKHFHKVKQRPGKPFWFGTTQDEKPVFALPGNPVSSFMCTNKYVLPWLRKHLGLTDRKKYAALASEIHFKPDLTYMAQVSLDYGEDGVLRAHPVEGNGSGDLANLTDANAFIELPRGKNIYNAGEVHRIHIMNPV